MSLSVWKIHRRIGMSGGLFVNALARELETPLDADTLAALPGLHGDAFIRRYDSVQALPGRARAAGDAVRARGAVGDRHQRPRALRRAWPVSCSQIPADTPMITRDQVRYAKPDPDLFLTAARQIGVDIRQSIVVGDSVWDLLAAQRARALGIGLLSGGYGREELFYSGAYRVFEDPAELLAHLDEVGVRRTR